MVELVDTQDLKSCGQFVRAGSSPAPGTITMIQIILINDENCCQYYASVLLKLCCPIELSQLMSPSYDHLLL